MMFLCFLILGVTLNAPILLAEKGGNSENAKITGSATDDESEEENEPENGRGKKFKQRVRFVDGEYEVESEVEIGGEGDDISALTSDGKRHRIRINPERAKIRLRERWNSTFNITNISLEEVRHKNIPRVVYKLQSDHPGRFLGLFKMALKVRSQVDPETGEVLASNVPWWAFLLTGLEIPEDLPGIDDGTEDDSNNETEESNDTNSTG